MVELAAIRLNRLAINSKMPAQGCWGKEGKVGLFMPFLSSVNGMAVGIGYCSARWVGFEKWLMFMKRLEMG